MFGQVFHAEADNPEFAWILRMVDRKRVRWELEELSGVALRRLGVDRAFQFAMDRIKPDYWVGYNNLMLGLVNLGEIEELIKTGQLMATVAGGRPGS